jgi:transcriptional regulator with XRE-family HTH domain
MLSTTHKEDLMAAPPLPPPKTNRLALYIAQIQDYWFHGPYTRFAKDAGVSPSTLSRILHGKTRPRYDDMCKIVALLEQKLGRKIDPREIYEP